MNDQRSVNLLGAAALAITDLTLADIAADGGTPSRAAALVTLSVHPGLGVTELAHRIGLTQSATTRLLDALEAEELIRRRVGERHRANVELTAAGRRVTRRVMSARRAPLDRLVETFDGDERDQLGHLLGKMLTRLYDEIGDHDLICRLCDRKACTTAATCPVGEAARDGGPAPDG